MTEAKAVPTKQEPVDEAGAQLDALERKAGELDTTPEQEEQQKEQAQEAVSLAEGARAAADMTAGVMQALVEVLAPGAAIDNRTARKAADKLAPLFEKYGVSIGGGGRWAQEVDAAVFFGMTGFTIWQQVQAEKAKEAEAGKPGEGEPVGSQ